MIYVSTVGEGGPRARARYSRPSLRMDMAAVPVAVTRSVSTGVVFLEYCVTF